MHRVLAGNPEHTCDDHVEIHELCEHFVFHIGHVQARVTVLNVLDNQAMVTGWT